MLTKADVLDAAGYAFDYLYGTYVNKPRRVVVSLKFTDDVSTEELEERLAQVPASGDWQFVFLEPPSTCIREKLLAEYA